MYLIFSFLLFSLTSFAVSFNPGAGWEVREKLLGADYALIEENGTNSIIVKKIPQEVTDSESFIKKIVQDKSNWVDSKIVSFENISTSGKMARVEHKKNNIPHTSFVGVQPSGKEYFLIYYSEEDLKFNLKDKSVLHALKSIKVP